ncbi:class I SAM-dependent methyltransferase [Desulfosporosinus youngiae]|nr:class I SAM-dependent methyltransferase [Desulfosporosinus youngiae]
MLNKLENPERVTELNPKETLIKIGLSGHDVLCDIGAGTGIFTYAAAGITADTIYAIEISEAMREILHLKNNIPNVRIEDSVQKVPTDSCDVVLLCTVLHELDNIPAMMQEIKRIMKHNGVLAIIEFHKEVTPMGPPVERRISERETVETLSINEFVKIKGHKLGGNFYCLVFKQAKVY